MKTYSASAYAKINLSLDILGKLPNGYHSVEMVMQQIPLSDEVTVSVEKGNEIFLSCSNPSVPTDHSNTAYKAARLFLDETELSAKIRIHIEKNIPVAAGMAGGSTDGAAVLKLLNQAFDNPLSEEKILKLCLNIGADVPFCYLGGCALSRGIGEILTPVSSLKNAYIVIGKPQLDVSTKWVYQNFKLENVTKHPDTSSVISAISNGDLALLKNSSANVLESVTEKEYPVISDYKKLLNDNGAVFSMMSGSGPTVFGIFDNKTMSEVAYDEISKLTNDSYLLRI
ncbi:MAG: 4-(cytidine 5'-diphospho)-2-C-methyl-D-erythritol kinase [Ruminococcaceae bacterium]|nr:4-(cytidine 5'-diphospho)-2-C-methyl-D-erythritol kinase [Oscillospiraceae bacterium]